MRRRSLYVLCMVLMTTRALSDEYELRTWTSAAGNYTRQAVFKSITDNKVTITTDDGRDVTLPLESLSEPDRQYVRELNEPTARKMPPAAPPNAADLPPAEDPPREIADPGQTTLDDEDALPTVELPMPAPALMADPSGRYLVCVQRVPDDFKWRDQFQGPASVRIAIVDMETRSVVAKRDFPPKLQPQAVSSEFLFAFNDRNIQSFALNTLSDVDKISAPINVRSLFVVGDRLLCSGNGSLRLDLPRLDPSVEFAGLNNAVDRPFGSQPIQAGWMVDCIAYGRSLRAPVALALSPFDLRPDLHPCWRFRQDRSPGEYWNLYASHVDRMELLVVGPDLRTTEGDLPVKLQLRHLGAREGAERQVGMLPRDFIRSPSPPSLHLPTDPRINADVNRSYSGAAHSVIPACLVGQRAVVVLDGTLHIWKYSADLVEALPLPARIRTDQLPVAIDPVEATVLHHTVIGGEGPYSFKSEVNTVEENGDVLINPETVLDPSEIESYFELHKLKTEEDVKELIASHQPWAHRLTGKELKELPYYYEVNLRANNASGRGVGLKYYVLIEIPAEAYAPILKPRAEAAAVELAEQEKAREEQKVINAQARKAQHAKAAREEQERERELRLARIQKLLSGVSFAVMAISLAGILAWVTSTWDGPRGQNPRGSRFVLAAATAFSVLLLLALLPKDIGTMIALATGPSLLILSLALCAIGTFVIVLDKGHPTNIAVMYTLFGPIGLRLAAQLDDEIQRKLERAMDLLSHNPNVARRRLNEIVAEYPSSKAALVATQILAEMEGNE